MRDSNVQRWSMSLGRWWGIPVRLHIFFVLFAVLAIAFLHSDLLTPGLLTVGVLLVSLVLHEVGHALAAIRVGGKVDAIVVGPVGGLVPPRVPDEPEVHLFVAMAGPMVHLLLMVAAAIALTVTGNNEVLELLNPVGSIDLLEGEPWLVACKLGLWINGLLLVLNLLPAYPFDGGPMLRAVLWPAFGRRTARIATARVAMVIGVGLAVAALLTADVEIARRIHLWIPLLTLGIFLFFSAQQDLAAGSVYEIADEMAGYKTGDELDNIDDTWSDDQGEQAVLVEHQQHQQQEQHRRAQEAYEDARVDDILARLHDSSLSALSNEELELLRRAGQRYKNRQRPQDDV